MKVDSNGSNDDGDQLVDHHYQNESEDQEAYNDQFLEREGEISVQIINPNGDP